MKESDKLVAFGFSSVYGKCYKKEGSILQGQTLQQEDFDLMDKAMTCSESANQEKMKQKAVALGFKDDIARCLVIKKNSEKVCTQQSNRIVHSEPDKKNKHTISEHGIDNSHKQKADKLVFNPLKKPNRCFYQLFYRHILSIEGANVRKKTPFCRFFVTFAVI